MYSFANSQTQNDAILSFTKRWVTLMKVSATPMGAMKILSKDDHLPSEFRKMCGTIYQDFLEDKVKEKTLGARGQGAIILNGLEASGLFSYFFMETLIEAFKLHNTYPVDALQNLLSLAAFEKPLEHDE